MKNLIILLLASVSIIQILSPLHYLTQNLSNLFLLSFFCSFLKLSNLLDSELFLLDVTLNGENFVSSCCDSCLSFRKSYDYATHIDCLLLCGSDSGSGAFTRT